MNVITGARPMACADAAAELSAPAAGSAASFAGVLLVEWPMPWPRDAAEVPELASLVAAMAQRPEPWRLQLIAGAQPIAVGDPSTVICYRHVAGKAGYHRFALRDVPAADVADRAAQLLLDPAAASPDESGADRVDFLVCTHGKRDTCCGGQGTRLFNELVALRALAGSGTSTALWRTSHLGGHRFAPTALALPDGTTWGRLDAESAMAVIERSAPVATLIGQYRGRASIDRPEIQVAEATAFAAHGWEWNDVVLSASHRPLESHDASAPESTVVLLNYRQPDGSAGGYRATVTRTGTIKVPPCRALDGKFTTDVVCEVAEFASVGGPPAPVVPAPII